MSTTTGKSAKSTATAKTAKSSESSSKSKVTDPKKPVAPVSATNSTTPVPAKRVEPTVVDSPQMVIVGPMMRKKELVDQVVTRSGMKKKDVKPVVETMLAVLGEALTDNRELNLPPLGRIKVRREKHLANGRMVVAKIRQPTAPDAAQSSASPAVKAEKSSD